MHNSLYLVHKIYHLLIITNIDAEIKSDFLVDGLNETNRIVVLEFISLTVGLTLKFVKKRRTIHMRNLNYRQERHRNFILTSNVLFHII